MKTSQILAAGALLAGYAQACTRIRVDNSRDQNNPNWKVSTVTAWDDDRPPIGVLDFASDVDREADTWLFRESSGQVDVMLRWPDGPFAKTIAGKVAFPWGKNYLSGGNTIELEQKADYTYWNETGVEHHIYCLWDNYNCGGYYCGI